MIQPIIFGAGNARVVMINVWNGTGWTQVASPNPGGSGQDNVLNGVAGVSRGNAFAAGYYANR
jgi:hypothetical protein